MLRRLITLAVLPTLLTILSLGRCCGPSVLRTSISVSEAFPWPVPLQSMRSWRAVALVRMQPRPRPLPVPTRGPGLKLVGEVERTRWGESEAGALTVSPNRRATLSLKGMVMRTFAAEGGEMGAGRKGGCSRDEARLPRGPRGEKEGEGGDLKGCLPWDGGGSEDKAEGRGGELPRGAGERLLLVVVVIVEVAEAVLDSRRDLLLRLSRLPPTRIRPGSENTVMIFVEVEDGGEGKGEGGDRNESKVAWAWAWAWAWACWGTSTWGSRSDRATSPRRLSEQGFCQMQFPVQLTRGSPKRVEAC